MDASRTRARGIAAGALGLTLVAAATLLSLRGMEPFATWYYVFAWYGTLVALDGALAATRPDRGFHLLSRPRHALSLLAWSVPFWLFFELLNFRLENWYYVFVPDHPVERWAGITVSFATVLPALFLLEATLGRAGVGRAMRASPVEVTPALRRRLRWTGVAMLVLPVAFPQLFYPLVWGAVVLLLDPLVHEWAPRRSLLGDLERGRPGRIVRLLVAGLAAGLLWEGFNVVGRGSWIYTVPALEELKLFEMPPLGFLGFPPLALEAFAFWQVLVALGWAVPRDPAAGRQPADGLGPLDRDGAPAPGRRAAGEAGARGRAGVVAATLAAALFSAAVLVGMERWTIVSHTPRLVELPEVPAARLRAAGHDVFSLADAAPAELARRAGATEERARSWVEVARLATLRGIGSRNAARLADVGVPSRAALAAADPAVLLASLRETEGPRLNEARVRVWVRGARRALDGD